jgi:hypothetical protein
MKMMNVYDDSGSEHSSQLAPKSIFKDKREEELEKDLDLFKFSVNEKLNLSTRQLTLKKVRYIFDEVFMDIKWKKIRTIEFQLWVFYTLCLLYLRMFCHYLGQYIMLTILTVPVTQFETHWYKIYVTYAEWTFMQIFATLAAGCLFNTMVFSIFILIAYISKKRMKCFPRIFYKVICWFGCLTLLDFGLIFFCDFVSASWEQGDAFALYNFYMKRDGTGIVGIYLTFFLYFGITVINIFIFYNYMIFIHMNGRILDLYKRLNGKLYPSNPINRLDCAVFHS